MPDITPDAPDVVAQAPQSKVGADAFQRTPAVGTVGLAPGLEALGSGLEEVAVPLAKAQAADDVAAASADPNKAKGVTTDVNGMPQLATPGSSFILGRAGEAYNEAVKAGTQADLQASITQKLTGLHAQNLTNPQGFLAGANEFAEGLRSQYGGALGNSLAAIAHEQASSRYAGLVDQNAARDTQAALQSVNTNVEDTRNQLNAMARQGTLNTPQGQQLQKQLNDGYDKLGSNPLFGYSADKIASEKRRAADDLNAQFVVGRVDETFARRSGDGGRAGAMKMLKDQIEDNPNLSLSDNERKHLVSWGMSRLDYLTGQQKAQIDANRETVNGTIDAIRKNPTSVPDAVYDQVLGRARDLGDAEGAARLSAARFVSTTQRPLSGLTDEQRFNAMAGGPSGGYLSALAQQESGGNPNARSSTSSAQGPYQFTTGTWNQLRLLHPELNLTTDGRTDPAQQQRAIVAFTNENRQVLQASGITPTDGNTYLAHFLGAGGATTFIKAMQANPGQAAAIVAPDAAAANKNVFYVNGDTTQPRSLQEVYALQTHRFGGGTSPVTSANGVPFTPQQAQANPFLLSEYVHNIASDQQNQLTLGKAVGTGLESSINAGIMPNATTLANYLQVAEQHPKEFGEQSQKIQAGLKGQDVAALAGQQPAGGGQTLIDQAETMAQGGSIFQEQIAEHAKKAYQQQSEALKKDPFGEAARRGWTQPVTPLDLTTPTGAQTLPQALQDRSVAATMIEGHGGGKQLPLSGDDLRQFSGAMGALDGASVSHTLTAFNALPGPQLDGLMANGEFKGTLLGLMRSGDPGKMQAAASFLDAQQRRNPLAFDADDGGALKQLRLWQDGLSYYTPQDLAKRMMRADDPAEAKAREVLEKQGQEQIKAVDGAALVAKFRDAPGWGATLLTGGLANVYSHLTAPNAEASDRPGIATGAMVHDYQRLFKDYYGEAPDATQADAYAMEKLRLKYGVSDVNGNRVMAYPPERYYGAVDGSHDWLKAQLADKVKATQWGRDHLGDDWSGASRWDFATGGVPTNAIGSIRPGVDRSMLLMQDKTTQADIAARRSPSYTVLAVGKDGRNHVVLGDDGQPFRFTGNEQAARDTANAAFRVRDRAARDAAAGADQRSSDTLLSGP